MFSLLQDMFKQKAKIKIKRKKNEVLHTNQDYNNALKLRHAGVLGLCSFISSHPYDVPDFLPDVFNTLSDHLNDPPPISVRILLY